jgi:CheY-like chemotaxis protein
VRSSRLDGFDLLSALKSDPEKRHVSLVFLTTDANGAERRQEAGGAALLRKPVDPKRLLEVIEAATRALRYR